MSLSVCVLNYASGPYRVQQSVQNRLIERLHPNYLVRSFDESDLPRLLSRLSKKFPINNFLPVLQIPKGDGLWSWKLLVLWAMFSEFKDGDILFYIDSGITPFELIDRVISFIEQHDFMVAPVSSLDNEAGCRAWLRTLPIYAKKKELIEQDRLFLHSKWDKRMPVDALTNKEQISAGIQGWRVCPRNQEHLEALVQDVSLANYDDVTAVSNPFYIEHRHDQSVLSAYVHLNELPIYTNRLPMKRFSSLPEGLREQLVGGYRA